MRCDNCKKNNMYCISSVCIGKETVMKDTTREETTKDKNGNVVKNIYHETKPHTYNVYRNTYICNDCNHKCYEKSYYQEKTWSSFEEFNKHRKNRYIIYAIIVLFVLGLIVGCSVTIFN